MKVQVIILLLLFLEPSQSAANRSALSELTHDLGIIARIINAIAIQTEWSTSGKLDATQLATEMIGLEQGSLELFQKVNISDAVWLLDWLVDETEKAQKLTEKLSLSEIEQVRKMNAFMKAAADNFLDAKVSGSKIAKDLFELIVNDTGTTLLHPCPLGVLQKANKFFSLVSGRSREQTHNQIMAIREFTEKTQVQELVKCLTNLKEFQGKITDGKNVKKTVEDLDQLLARKNLAKRMNSREAELQNAQGVFAKNLKKMEIFMTKITSLWSAPVPFDSKHIDRMFVNYDKFDEHHRLGKTPKPNTAGFPHIITIHFVRRDLKQAWFLENIVRGKDAELAEIETALQPFFGFTDKLGSFHDKFIQSRSNFTVNFAKLNEVNTTIDEFLRFGGKPYDTIVGSLRSLVEKCSSSIKLTDPSQPNFQTFESKIANLLGVRHDFKNVLQLVGELEAKVDVGKFNKTLSSMEVPEEEGIEEFEKRYKKEELFLKSGEILEQLWKVQNDMVEKIYNLKTGITDTTAEATKINIDKYLDNSNATGYFKCLQSGNFDFKTLEEVVAYTAAVVAFPGESSTTPMRAFLGSFEQMQLEYTALLKFVENEKRLKRSKALLKKFVAPMKLTRPYGNGVRALHEFNMLLVGEKRIMNATNITKGGLQLMFEKADPILNSVWFGNPLQKFEKMFKDLAVLEGLAKTATDSFGNTDKTLILENIKKVFQAAKSIPEIAPIANPLLFNAAHELHNAGHTDDAWKLMNLVDYQLDYARFGGDLSDASSSLEKIRNQFNKHFGFVSTSSAEVIYIENEASFMSHVAVALICIGVFGLLVLAAIVGYGFTASGKTKYQNWYLYYFPNMTEFEKRWRYSLFMDTVEEANIVTDCTREYNITNLKKALKRGAYINAYNFYGNTALHTATELLEPALVELLITHGADRTLLNFQNWRAEQLIPRKLSSQRPSEQKKFEEIKRIYAKHQNKKYRIRVPQKFPASSFHLFIESRPDDDLCNSFMNSFRSICSDEAMTTTTHCIVQVNKEGILETDDFSVLIWIFRGTIIVKEQWMRDCLADERIIEKDHLYLVESVKYRGVVFKDAILPWSRALAKRELPYLHGVHLLFVMKECPLYDALEKVIRTLGGQLHKQMPPDMAVNKGTHPFLHSDKPPFWIVHDDNFDMDEMANHPDKLFWCMHFEQFVEVLLRRQVNRDKRINPPQTTIVHEEDK